MKKQRGFSSFEEYFWSNVVKSASCWLWSGSICSDGYGRLYRYVDGKKKVVRAHRISFEIANGYEPSDGQVLHKCDNRRCIRPDHLYLGTHEDNMRDMVNRRRQPRGERAVAAILSQAEADEIRKMHSEGGWNNQRLADLFGVSRMTVSRIVRGERYVHPA